MLDESEEVSLNIIVVITIVSSIILIFAGVFTFFIFNEEIKDPIVFLILLFVTILLQIIPVKYFYDNYGLLKDQVNESEDSDKKE